MSGLTQSASISCWANGKDPQCMSRAETLQEMKLLYSAGVRDVKPSIVTYSWIMSCLE